MVKTVDLSCPLTNLVEKLGEDVTEGRKTLIMQGDVVILGS